MDQVTLQQSLKLNLIFEVSQTKIQIVLPLWTHMGHIKNEARMEKLLQGVIH